MDNKEVRDFYEEEAAYEKAIFIIKDLITKIISVDINIYKEKLEYLNIYDDYSEFIDLLIAVLGKKTNKYYYAETEDDIKYYDLELKKVYRLDKINLELQAKNNEEKILKLEARALLAEKLLIMIRELKDIFQNNIEKGDGSLVTIDSRIITEHDVEYFENLILYLEKMIDKNGRLKILVAEQDVYKKIKEQEEFNKKGVIGKFFSKLIK